MQEQKPTHDARGYKLPTLPTPFPGYSMMEDVKRQQVGDAERIKAAFRPKKKKKKEKTSKKKKS